MKTLLVPVDFTATSENTLDFAALWSRSFDYERIILLKTFYDSMFESIGIAAEYSTVNQEHFNRQREDAREQLQVVRTNLEARVQGGVKVVTAVSEDPLVRSIVEMVKNEKPELIIVGSDNFEHSGDSIIAGNVISIAKLSPVRVLIVPSDYAFREVQDALIPLDFNTQYPFDKLKTLKITSKWTAIKLSILNVDAKERYLKPDRKYAELETILHQYLADFDHKIHYSNENNVIKGIQNFSDKNDLQLIIALPGKNSFLYNLTHSSISEAIYRNARLPVLILK